MFGPTCTPPLVETQSQAGERSWWIMKIGKLQGCFDWKLQYSEPGGKLAGSDWTWVTSRGKIMKAGNSWRNSDCSGLIASEIAVWLLKVEAVSQTVLLMRRGLFQGKLKIYICPAWGWQSLCFSRLVKDLLAFLLLCHDDPLQRAAAQESCTVGAESLKLATWPCNNVRDKCCALWDALEAWSPFFRPNQGNNLIDNEDQL